MLSSPEKIIFILAVMAVLYATWRSVDRLKRIIGRGSGQVDWKLAPKRLVDVVIKVLTMQPTFNTRIIVSIFHLLVVWGFSFYMLVNLGDVLQGFIPGFQFLGNGIVGDVYHFVTDVLTVAILVSIAAFLVRRFVMKSSALTTRQTTLLHPKARAGISRDSAIVGLFVLVHVGSRFLGESFALAQEGKDAWQPFASLVSTLWIGWGGLEIARHAAFWLALGTIMLFFLYFPYSKHIHLFFAPLNYLVKPPHRALSELSKIDFDDEKLEVFGANHLEELAWPQLMDAYACIMCYRCQEACPAYNTGKLLSPSALEINKRYYFNFDGNQFANGEDSSMKLTDFAIPTEAIWACTTCGACINICPVNNEPMKDILDIRRSLVLMDNEFPAQLQPAFRGMERAANPWGVPPAERMKWAKDLNISTIEKNPEPDILWWVGCAPATDARAQKTARSFAKILKSANVNYAVLGQNEQCTGDSARRAGKEDLFFQLATANVEILNEVAPKRIVTTCPHCLHTLKNEYPAFGGNYEVIHHSQFIQELISAGKLELNPVEDKKQIAYHDPCYLSRHNGIQAEPRSVLNSAACEITEMARSGAKTFCCGAGGAQVWKEEEHGTERIQINRIHEVEATGAEILAVGCPFCMTMMSDAAKDTHSEMKVLDIAEIVEERLKA
ncbi:MAG: heterodisulfide reductase-related iron-sulfur binding cluster [Anaerolineaceae bacterium]|nr:heterodisulfide reductase-related iron-sulfur binding cluster [Anaerolineaceae bacterium]